MKQRKSGDFGGAIAQQGPLGNVGACAALRQHCLVEAICGQEATTRVPGRKKPLNLTFILCCGPLVCM